MATSSLQPENENDKRMLPPNFELSEPEAEAACEIESGMQHEARPEEACRKAADASRNGDVRRMCPFCGRYFIPSSLERHQRVCQQVFGTTRPQFNAMKGSALSSKASLVQVNPPKQDRRLRANVAALSRSNSDDLGAPAQFSPSRAQSDKKPSALFSDNKVCKENTSFESIKVQEQRVISMLEQQLEELKEMRRQCGQGPDPNTSACSEDDASCEKPLICSPSVNEDACNSPNISAQPAEVNQISTALKVCEDCGRSFNAASFEKHRTICRTVFGKPDRAPFESQRQRLRCLQGGLDVSPVRDRTSGREAFYPSFVGESSAASSTMSKSNTTRKSSSTALFPKSGATSSGSFSREASAHAPEETSSDCASSGYGLAKLTSPQKPLTPCPYCGRCFRAAAFDKHVKVCQSVFPTHDARGDQRHVYDSRRHRLKGTAFEAYTSASPTSPQPDRGCSSTPPMPPKPALPTRARRSSRSPKAPLLRTASESQIRTSRTRSTSPISPVSRSGTPSEAFQHPWPQHGAYQLVEERRGLHGGLDHSQASSFVEDTQISSTSDMVAQLRATSAEDRNGVRRFLEDRRGKLERARLDMKISQHQDYATLMEGSSSEQALHQACQNRGEPLQERSPNQQNGESTKSLSCPSGVTRQSSYEQDKFMLGSTRFSRFPSGKLRQSSRERGSVASPTNACSQSQPVLRLVGSEDHSPFIVGGPALTRTTLHASAERRERSVEDDERSYYKRCLEHLDSVGGSQLAASTSVLEHTSSKPGLGREDPIAEAALRTGTNDEESPSSKPALKRKASHDAANIAELNLVIAKATAALLGETSEHRVEPEVDTGQRRPSTPINMSLNALFGNGSMTPLDPAPCRGKKNICRDTTRSMDVEIAPSSRQGRLVTVVPPRSVTQEGYFRTVAGDAIAGGIQTTPREPFPACLRSVPVVATPSSVTLRGIEIGDVPAQQRSSEPPLSAYVVPQRGQSAQRSDIRRVSQTRELIRAFPVPPKVGNIDRQQTGRRS